MTIEELKEAHKHSINNKLEILNSKICGCFYCNKIFKSREICRWIQDENATAICPYCFNDTVIGDVSGVKITANFLNDMHDYWIR